MKKTIFLFALVMGAALISNAQNRTKAPPPPPAPPSPKVEIVHFTPPVIVDDEEIKDFYTRNPTVAKIRWTGPEKVVLTLKNKKIEKYNLANDKEKKAFTDKYGEVPQPAPPPPPPAPPAAPKEIQ